MSNKMSENSLLTVFVVLNIGFLFYISFKKKSIQQNSLQTIQNRQIQINALQKRQTKSKEKKQTKVSFENKKCENSWAGASDKCIICGNEASLVQYDRNFCRNSKCRLTFKNSFDYIKYQKDNGEIQKLWSSN